ncbi:TPA: hypothetical protein VU720_001786 [Streptococcus pneumoniae]|uniref:tRNA_anti-like n=1 Tax=Streptococcus pneumoniae TaxID=1313 RepID=A0A0T9AC28_STREE|nr:hypothetical protein [Streptococcus pneumoniae]EPD20698.1 hypothetical protein SP4UMMC_05938 [Streptococcus pneumoniae MNZ14]KGI36139.1 hypothetical protein X231_0240 [Streptococcus pneumoniae ECC_3510]KXW44857.1 hypothetical protein NTPn46_05010 [Streptococcus pneumoniae]KXW53210.1 hypothetical protein NTPn50_01845 [Streptococcus pneumoniae]MBW7492243.1 hypothetical protein [Streptococcus pneumoniae]
MNIGKIIKITEDTAYIGYEDGSLKEIPIESCDFEPSIGDYVEVYEGIVIKVDINKNNIEKKNQYKKIGIIVTLLLLFVIIVISFINTKEQISNNQTTSSSTSKQISSSKKSSSTSSSSLKESSSSSSSSVPSKPKVTVDNDKANYSEVDYNSWNHDEIAVDTKVRVYGKVLQAMENGKAYTLRVAINDDYDKIILVSIPSEYNNRVIAEDDHITLYGLVKGRQSYETVFKATKTLPLMVAYMYEN